MLELWSNDVTFFRGQKAFRFNTETVQKIKRIQLLLKYVKSVISGSAFFSVICTEFIMENTFVWLYWLVI